MDHETKIAWYLASESFGEKSERRRYEVDETTRLIYLKAREAYWTLTRLVGLAQLHDGSKEDAKRIAAAPEAIADSVTDSQAIGAMAHPRTLIDMTAVRRLGLKGGIQRVVRQVATHALESGRGLPVYIENGTLKSYCRHPLVPETIEIEEGDRFLMLDAGWGFTDEYPPIMRMISDANGENIVGLYDLIPLIYPTTVEYELLSCFRRWFETVVLASDAIACISKSTFDSFSDFVAKNKCDYKAQTRVGWWKLGADFNLGAAAPISRRARDIASGDTPYFLSVGTLEPRKGYSIALSAFETLWGSGVDVRYVVVGRRGWQFAALERRIREHAEFGRRLFWLDDADDADLDHLYRRAHCLVFASFAEGFGLPLVEAGRYDLPVIASDIPAFREVGGNAVRYFDVLDSKSLARNILDVYGERPAGGEIAFETWSDSTDALLDMIKHDLFQHGPTRRGHAAAAPVYRSLSDAARPQRGRPPVAVKENLLIRGLDGLPEPI